MENTWLHTQVKITLSTWGSERCLFQDKHMDRGNRKRKKENQKTERDTYSRKYLNAKINIGNIWKMYDPERHINDQENTSVERIKLCFIFTAKASLLWS